MHDERKNSETVQRKTKCNVYYGVRSSMKARRLKTFSKAPKMDRNLSKQIRNTKRERPKLDVDL